MKKYEDDKRNAPLDKIRELWDPDKAKGFPSSFSRLDRRADKHEENREEKSQILAFFMRRQLFDSLTENG